MSDWTLGAIKARNMEINALCAQEACRHLFVFNLDALIEGVGPDYPLADFPPMECPASAPDRLRSGFLSPSPRPAPRTRRNDPRTSPPRHCRA